MKRVLTAVVLTMFTAGLIGCHASADIDGPDHDNDTAYKKTETMKKADDGAVRTTKTETKTTVDH